MVLRVFVTSGAAPRNQKVGGGAQIFRNHFLIVVERKNHYLAKMWGPETPPALPLHIPSNYIRYSILTATHGFLFWKVSNANITTLKLRIQI